MPNKWINRSETPSRTVGLPNIRFGSGLLDMEKDLSAHGVRWQIIVYPDRRRRTRRLDHRILNTNSGHQTTRPGTRIRVNMALFRVSRLHTRCTMDQSLLGPDPPGTSLFSYWHDKRTIQDLVRLRETIKDQ